MIRRLQAASDELLHLDLLRLIASCGIVLLHFARFLSPETRAVLGPLGGLTLFVDLFFAISGFVIAYVYSGRIGSPGAYGSFLWRRVARLAPLHWATFLLFLMLGLLTWSGVMESDHPEIYDPRCVLPNLLAVHAWGLCRALSLNDVSWSVSAEMAMYIVAPLLLLLGSRRPFVLVAFASGLILLLSRAPVQPWLEWTWNFGAVRALPSFAVGVALYQFRKVVARLPAPRTVAGVALVLFLFGVRAEWSQIALLPITYVLVACAVACDLSGRYPPLRIGALGQLTYSLYMLHPLVRTFGLSFAGQRILRLEGWAADVAVLLAVGVTFLLAYCSFLFFESPARRWLAGQGRACAGRHGAVAAS